MKMELVTLKVVLRPIGYLDIYIFWSCFVYFVFCVSSGACTIVICVRFGVCCCFFSFLLESTRRSLLEKDGSILERKMCGGKRKGRIKS